MSFVKYNEKGLLLDTKGNPIHLVGINYVARYVCTNFWEDWRPEIIEEDLKQIAGLGLEAVRIPMHWGFIEPEQGKYNPVILERFQMFLDFCKKYRLYIMPWFLVGVATNDYDVPFRNGRPFFTGEMVEVAQNHLRHFIAHFKDEEQILFWDICDEPEWYSRHGYGAEQLPFNRQDISKWVKAMYDAIKSVDQNHMVTLGFGHIAVANYGMDVRDMAEILDLMVVTAYPGFSDEAIDSCRNSYVIPFHVKMNTYGKPVFTCEAPGHSSVAYSDNIIGQYYKISLYSNLLNGSTGVMPWVYNDFERSIWHQRPLDKYTIEPGFGIVTVDGKLKPAGKELRDFTRFVKENDMGRYHSRQADTAILIPEGYYSRISPCVEKIYTSWLLAKGNGADADLVWDNTDFSGYKLVIIPATARITTNIWDKIRRYVEKGGNIYYIYDTSEGLNGYFNELFGVEVQTPEKDYGYDKLIMKQAWGGWKQGDAVKLSGSGRKQYLKVKPQSAEVICEFENGVPAVLKNCYGNGCAYLSTIPLENGLLEIRVNDFVENESFHIYDILFDECGVLRTLKSTDPRIEIGYMENADTGETMVICLNHDNQKLSAKLYPASPNAEIYMTDINDNTGLMVSEKGIEVSFAPAGVKIYRLT